MNSQIMVEWRSIYVLYSTAILHCEGGVRLRHNYNNMLPTLRMSSGTSALICLLSYSFHLRLQRQKALFQVGTRLCSYYINGLYRSLHDRIILATDIVIPC